MKQNYKFDTDQLFYILTDPKNVDLESFDRHRSIFTADLWFCRNFKVKI